MSIQHTIVHFEIPVTDFKRAQAFYANILAGEVEETRMGESRMGFLPREKDGVGGAIIEEEGAVPGTKGPLLYLNGGADLQVILDRIEPAGGHILMPKTIVTPEIGYYAIFLDSEGNRLALHSEK